MAKYRVKCSKCDKPFKKYGSIAKHHGWCGGTEVPLDPGQTAPSSVKSDMDVLFDVAEAEGAAAARECTPEPMHVVERANPLDDGSPIVKQYAPVMGGVCGFAWVWVKGNSAIGRAAKKRYANADFSSDVRVHKGYPTGLNIWVSGFGQSMETKEAYARAYCHVLTENGHEAHVESRMD